MTENFELLLVTYSMACIVIVNPRIVYYTHENSRTKSYRKSTLLVKKLNILSFNKD